MANLHTVSPWQQSANVELVLGKAGGDAEMNAAIVKDVLCGKEDGAKKDIVVLNAAAAIIASGKADDFAGGIELAEGSISSGAAEDALSKLVKLSNE